MTSELTLPMTIKGRVTADHIVRGEQGSRTSCPIALMIHELLGPEWYVQVEEEVTVIRDGVHLIGKLPGYAIDFVDDFDGQREVSEFDLYMEVDVDHSDDD